MSQKQKVLFIVNPISGGKKPLNINALVDQHLNKEKFEYDIYHTQKRGDATDRSKKAVADGVDIVVAVGGDGTINEVAQGLIGTNVALGIIPRGSGNGFANYFGIPHNPAKALATLNSGQPRSIDTGTLNGKLFLNVAGVGFDAHIVAVFDVFGKRGLLSYIYLSIKEYFQYKAKTYTLTIGDKVHETEAFLITAANSSQFGNNAFIAPNAKIDDGLLDIVVLQPANIIGIITISLRMFLGTLDKSNYCQTYRTSRLTITNSDQVAQVDGEPIEATKELDIVLHPKSLNVIA